MKHLSRDLFPELAREEDLPRPNVWDWLGFLSVAYFLFWALFAGLGVDLYPLLKIPETSYGLWLTLVSMGLLIVLPMFAVMRLATTGWLRQVINRSRAYPFLTLLFYWGVAILASLGLSNVIAAGEFRPRHILGITLFGALERWFYTAVSLDGVRISFGSQPVIFSIFVVSISAGIIALFVRGGRKFAQRRL